MKIIVTGGAGFIGSHIVDAYIKGGHEVVVIDNLSTGKCENLNPKARFYHADICSPEIEEIFRSERPEVLNHHAAQISVRESVANPVNDCTINVLGFLHLMEAGRKNGLKKVIFASSGGTVYGEQKEFPATEDHPTNPISPYGVAKLACEKYLHFYYIQYGILYIALRYANVYGPRQNPHGEAGVIAIFANKMLKDEQPIINGDGKYTRDYVYIKDVVNINKNALHDMSCDVYNVGKGVEIDVNAIFTALKELTGSSCKKIHGVGKPGEQLRSAILSAKSGRVKEMAVRTSFNNGLAETVEWFKQAIKQTGQEEKIC